MFNAQNGHLVSETYPAIIDRITFSTEKHDDMHKNKKHIMVKPTYSWLQWKSANQTTKSYPPHYFDIIHAPCMINERRQQWLIQLGNVACPGGRSESTLFLNNYYICCFPNKFIFKK